MRLILRNVEVKRGIFQLQGTGTFSEGIHLVWGPIGCGKTTLALLIAGLVSPEGGEVVKEGLGHLGFLMQFPEYQITSRTLIEEIESWGTSPDPILRETELGDCQDRDPLTLSRGEMKRLLLSTFLRIGPDLLLLDEPFGGMDCLERRKMIGRISTTSSRIIIIFSHDHGLLPLFDHLWEMDRGRLIYRGAMPEALSAWSFPPLYLESAIRKETFFNHNRSEGRGKI